MTRPIFEPSTQRSLASQGYAARQLFRRPGQIPEQGTGTVEYIRLQSDTAWNNTLTDLDFVEIQGSYNDGVTFDVNADDNVEIMRPGHYFLELTSINSGGTGSGTEWVLFQFEAAIVAGATPNGNFAATVYVPTLWPGMPFGSNAPNPTANSGFFQYDSDAFDMAGPSEIQIQALQYIDGIATATSDPFVRFSISRLGDPYV